MTTQTFTSNPVHVAGGLRMMARHLLSTIDPNTAHPDRLHQVADDAEALIVDARRLVGEDQHDMDLWRQISALRDAAYAAEPWLLPGNGVEINGRHVCGWRCPPNCKRSAQHDPSKPENHTHYGEALKALRDLGL